MANFAGNNEMNVVGALQIQRDLGLSDNEVYYNPAAKINKSKELVANMIEKGYIRKDTSMTATSGGTYTSYGLLPLFPDATIVDEQAYETPLVALLPRRACAGPTYVYNSQTALASAVFQKEESGAESVADTYTTSTFSIKILRTYGKVTGFSQRAASATGYINLQSEVLRSRIKAMNQKLENEIINGYTTTDANGFNGLVQSITTHSTAVSGSVELEDIRTMLAGIYHNSGTPGYPKYAITDGYTLNYLKGLVMDYMKWLGPVGDLLPIGIPGSFEFDGVVFMKDQYMTTTSGSRRIIFVDPRFVFLAVLQEMTYEELAKDGDWSKFMLKWYGTLAVVYEEACGQLTSIN